MKNLIKNMTTEQIMDIGNNHKVVWGYYVSAKKAFDSHFSLYLNKENGEIFKSYEASRNTWLEGDDIVRICGTKDKTETFQMWCGEWYIEWLDRFFEPTLADTIDYI